MNSRWWSILLMGMVAILASCTNSPGSREAEEKMLQQERQIETLNTEEKMQLSAVFTGSIHEEIDSLMRVYEKRFRFNGSVFVAYNRIPAYHKTFGYADFEEKELLTKSEPFQLASVSKQFTAVAIIMLIEEDKLAYTDTVSNHIKDFPYPRVTVEQLLHHTAGMPNYMWLLEHKWKQGREAYNDDIIRLMKKHGTNLYFRPGTRYDYSNTGYAVLAYLVEVVSGKSFPDFMEDRVFKPLGMKNTFVYSRSLNRQYPEKLKGYYRRWRRYNVIKETVHDGVVGDKGVYSTAADLFKWDQALYDDRLISDSSRKRAFTSVKVRSRWEYPYGYGFRLKKLAGKRVVYHTGLWEGFRTNLMRYIEDKNTIIVLNHTNANVNSVMINRIENILKNGPKPSATFEIVNRALESGLDEGMRLYLKYKNQGKSIDRKKILTAAELLSVFSKPVASSVLLEMYEQITSDMSVQEKIFDEI